MLYLEISGTAWGLFTLIVLIVLAFVIFLITVPFFIVEAAEKRGRNGVFWFFFSWFISPFLAALLLIALGETEEKRREKWKEEELFWQNLKKENRSPNEKNEENERLKRLLEKTRNS